MDFQVGRPDYDYVAALIQHVARAALLQRGLSEDDAEDLQQELWLGLLRASPQYEPARGSVRTFADRVVRHHASNVLDRWTAACRDPRRCVASVEQLEGDFSADGNGSDGCFNLASYLRASAGADWAPLADLKIDVRRAIETLPPEFRELCFLRRSMSISAIARQINIPRTTLQHRFHRIRESLEREGLAEYFERSAVSRTAAPVCKG